MSYIFAQKLKELYSRFFRSKDELDLVNGSMGKNLFYLSLPIMIINLLRVTYSITDMFWIGRISKEALSAITFSMPLVFLIVSLGMGIAVAGSVLVAQNEGKGDSERVNFAASQTVVFSLFFSLVAGAVLYFSVGPLLSLLGAEGVVLRMGREFLQVISMGLFSFFGFSIFISLMRGYGDTLTPMVVMFFAVVLNIVLDPFLIFGLGPFPELGVMGGAVATVFARGLAFLVGLYILFSGRKGIRISLKNMVPEPGMFMKMVRVGFPASFSVTSRAISVNILVAIVGTFSNAVVAGYGIGVRIFSLIFMPASAASRGVATMTGQNIGAGNIERAESVGLFSARYMFYFQTLLGALIFFLAGPIVSIFTQNPEVISTGSNFLKITALTFGFVGAKRSFTGAFRGGGNTLLAAVVTLFSFIIVRIPVAYFMSESLGSQGIWWSFPLSNVIGVAVAYLIYENYDWIRDVSG